jgi:hypothetical protein
MATSSRQRSVSNVGKASSPASPLDARVSRLLCKTGDGGDPEQRCQNAEGGARKGETGTRGVAAREGR